MQEFLTTKEVATLLRVKERKVYELAGRRAIPASRVTGKLLFPRDLLEAWVRRHVDYDGAAEMLAPRPTVVAGSHDPLLEWAIRESGCELATLFDGSLDGLGRVAAGKALAAGMHVYEPAAADWNVAHVTERLGGEAVVLIEWCTRVQGLVVPPGNPRRLTGVADLAGMRLVPRQPDAGSRVLLDHLMREAQVDSRAVVLIEPPARSESDVALLVAEGAADAGLAIETVSRQHRLDFVPLFCERYDLVVWRREFFEAQMQRLLDFCAREPFARRASALGGYDVSALGRVRYNGP
jgi:excisionase family DNA binding protein